MMQLTLEAEANRLARAGDGPGSHVAAERIVRSGKAERDRQECRNAVQRWPGRSSAELARLAGLDRHMAGRRLPECFARGMVTRTEGPPPRHEWRWWPA